mmetsp:Transcript_121629/g.344681  ORF Transcript_121629/g.344681 Transcript_121629/m.344681 type:complete len:260 (-) Transcript_121629:109-888(-)
MILSVRRYWRVVEDDVKMTHVDDVATATLGSTPMIRKKGEKMRPPPIPTKPARQPVSAPITRYCTTCAGCQFAWRMQSWLQYSATAAHTEIGTASVSDSAHAAPRRSLISSSSRSPTKRRGTGGEQASLACPSLPPRRCRRQLPAWWRSTPQRTTTSSMHTPTGALAPSAGPNAPFPTSGADSAAAGAPRRPPSRDPAGCCGSFSSRYWDQKVHAIMQVIPTRTVLSRKSMAKSSAVWFSSTPTSVPMSDDGTTRLQML